MYSFLAMRWRPQTRIQKETSVIHMFLTYFPPSNSLTRIRHLLKFHSPSLITLLLLLRSPNSINIRPTPISQNQIALTNFQFFSIIALKASWLKYRQFNNFISKQFFHQLTISSIEFGSTKISSSSKSVNNSRSHNLSTLSSIG